VRFEHALEIFSACGSTLYLRGPFDCGAAVHGVRAKFVRVRIDRREDAVRGTLAFLTPMAAVWQFVGRKPTGRRGGLSAFWLLPGVEIV
jgi:hypothetical protein